MNGRVWEVRMGDGVAGDAGDAGRGKRRREGERKHDRAGKGASLSL